MVPAFGHTNPTLPLAKELLNRGHDVTYYTVPSLKESVESNGARAVVLQTAEDPADTISNRDGAPNEEDLQGHMMHMFVENQAVTNEVMNHLEQEEVDVIVYDPMSAWGKAVVLTTQAKTVSFNTSFAINEEILTEIAGTFSFPEQVARKIFLSTGDENIVPVPYSFQPWNHYVGDEYTFVGPLASKRKQQEDEELRQLFKEKEKIVYISLGSVVSNREFYHKCIRALANEQYHVVLKIGGSTQIEDLGELPRNITVKRFVPQLQVLENADVFLTHGGFNSTMEALEFGVPLIVAPHMADQPLIAQQVESLRLGVKIDANRISEEALRTCIHSMLHGGYSTESMMTMKDEIARSGGIPLAVSIIESRKKESS